MKTNIDLFEYLSDACHLEFISDLLDAPNLKNELNKMVENQTVYLYPLSQWQQFVHYISHKDIQFNTIDEIMTYLLK